MERMDILVAEESNGKTYFTKVGVAFPTRDGTGYMLKFPPGVSVGGQAIMKPPKPREPRQDDGRESTGYGDRPPWA